VWRYAEIVQYSVFILFSKLFLWKIDTIAYVTAFSFPEEGGVGYDGQKFISISAVLKILTPCSILRMVVESS